MRIHNIEKKKIEGNCVDIILVNRLFDHHPPVGICKKKRNQATDQINNVIHMGILLATIFSSSSSYITVPVLHYDQIFVYSFNNVYNFWSICK